jgi:ligand-binding SRPBCC domain-containing protein
MSFYQIKLQILIPGTSEEVWDFISSPLNLKRITPESIKMEIVGEVPTAMYAGMIIKYRVKPFAGISMDWVSEITEVEEGVYFVDEQRKGPYKMWHHQHIIEEAEGGVLMTDIVSYLPPFGILGRALNGLFIRRTLKAIFAHREKAIQKIFDPSHGDES